jgi:hypothetical protein
MREGDVVRSRILTPVNLEPIPLPAPEGLTHVQFRRFAGCPICNLHLRSFVRRLDDLTAAAVHEIVLFHSTADELRPHAGDLPFPAIPDPTRKVYFEFGVESALRALLNPRVWPTMAGAITAAVVRRDRLPRLRPTGGRFGLPADVLIDPSGRIVAVKYGTHAYDQWSVDEVLAHARRRARVA